MPWLVAAAVVVLIAQFLPRKAEELGPIVASKPLPERLEGWVGVDLDSPRLFFNSLPIGRSQHMRYERPRSRGRRPELVDVYVARRSARDERSSLLSSKFAWLGPDWKRTRRSATSLWQVGSEGEWSVNERDGDRSLVLTWNVGARTPVAEALATLFAVDRLRPSDAEKRLVIRLSTMVRSARSEAVAIENAERMIVGFLGDFAPTFVGYAAETSSDEGVGSSRWRR